MLDGKQGIRAIFACYGRMCLAAGLVILALLLVLWLFRWLVDWNTPFDPSGWLIFLSGFIVVAVSLGPFVVTVGQLAGVQRLRATLRTGPASSPLSRRLTLAGLVITALVFAALVILSRSFMIWFTFGGLFTLMGLTLYYLAWRIGQIEKRLGVTIFQTGYTWRFDKVSYVGVFNAAPPAVKK